MTEWGRPVRTRKRRRRRRRVQMIEIVPCSRKDTATNPPPGATTGVQVHTLRTHGPRVPLTHSDTARHRARTARTLRGRRAKRR